MVYLKATVVGIVAAVIFGVAWICIDIVLPLWWQMRQARSQGSGGIASVSTLSGSVLVAALVGFVLGFLWIVRRASR